MLQKRYLLIGLIGIIFLVVIPLALASVINGDGHEITESTPTPIDEDSPTATPPPTQPATDAPQATVVPTNPPQATALPTNPPQATALPTNPSFQITLIASPVPDSENILPTMQPTRVASPVVDVDAESTPFTDVLLSILVFIGLVVAFTGITVHLVNLVRHPD
jgi:hypothetical protein